MIRIAICDDEQKDTELYGSLVKLLAKKNKIDVEMQVYESGEALLFEWKEERNQADILLLDIHMPKKNGIVIGQELRRMNVRTEIIFLTKDSELMFHAFDLHAFHYIVKGQTEINKTEEIILRCMRAVEDKQQQYIQLSCAGEVRNIRLSDISYFEVVNHIIIVHYGKGQRFEFYTTLGKLESSLLERGFLRIHKSFLINKNQVNVMSNKSLILKDGSELPVGRTKVTEVREALDMQDDNKVG